MSARDKKIILAIVPVVLVLAFWFLILSPKRAEVSTLDAAVASAQQQRDDANAKAGTLEGAKANYARDYATVVRLGKAVPSTVDMPSLLVQLDSASKGTHIKFDSVKAGDRSGAAATPAATPAAGASGSSTSSSSSSSGSSSSGSTSTTPAPASGSTSTTTTPSGGSSSGSSSTSTPPATGSTTPSATAGASASSSGVQGLDSVPLDFTFTGSYFDLADFFHTMKRFVRMANGDVQVKGRLLTIDKVKFDSTTFPKIQASVSATVYLSPKSQGTTAGGTASGPTGTGATATPTPAAAGGSSNPTPSTGTSGGAAQ